MQYGQSTISRRDVLAAAGSAIALADGPLFARSKRAIDLIKAPTNLGLRPDPKGKIPGTWRAADVLIQQGLARRLPIRRIVSLPRLPYSTEPEPGTKLRNGGKIRAFNLALAKAVERARRSGSFPLVIGGECSDLLGGLLGLRRTGGRGLIHVDGHSDFLQESTYPPGIPLRSAAGMDLALATGRGDRLLTVWPGVSGPLVADADAFQIGERYAEQPEAVTTVEGSAIPQITVQKLKKDGVAATANTVAAMMKQRSLSAAWLHIDADVLDKAFMPAVDSPGEPGLTFEELSALISALLRTGRIGGADIAIYDPDMDPDRKYARGLVDCVAKAFAGLS